MALDGDALPFNGNVVGGQVSLDYTTPNELHVHQGTDRAVIDWDSFNIGADALTQFHQPSSYSLIVNRVVGDGDPTQIMGRMAANGRVMVLDRNGVFFGENAQINVGSIIVSTGDLTNENAMNGNTLHIDDIGADGLIINNGTITVEQAGLAALVAPAVINNGFITAKMGRIDLAAGSKATIDLYGDGLVELQLDQSTQQILSNNGVLHADGGTIAIQAAAAKDVVDNVINNTGIIAANSVSMDKSGKIILHAQGANKTTAEGDSSTINNGYITASGYDDGERGGSIDLLGDVVLLGSNAVINASGDAGGGSIRIGGDYLGSGDTPTSIYTYVDQGAYILNDAITSGNGGRTIIWSDHTTNFHGSVLARGGALSGNGGFVETSGKINLLANGFADLTAANGNKGTYLLDPADITIYGNFAPTDIAGLQLWLDSSDSANLSLTYNSMGSTANGTTGSNTITVSNNAGLHIGARIRLGTSGLVTSANTMGPDTYEIINISGNTITLGTNLTTNYSTAAIYQAYVSQIADKSGQNNDATQAASNRMPLWLNNSLNGLQTIKYDGSNDALTFTEIQNVRSAFLTLNNLGKPAYATFLGHTVDGPFFHGSNTANDLFDATYTSPSVLNGQGFINGLSITPISMQVSSAYRNIGLITTSNTEVDNIGNDRMVYGRAWNGNFGDIILYDNALSTNSRNLIEQYQSEKWGIGLDPLVGAGTEAAEAMDATNGYGAFTTRYLERLSTTADIVLQASNSITLDLKGDTLNLANDRSITLTTTAGDIRTNSAGSIVTNRTGTGGNITFDASDDIAFNHAFTLNAQNGGLIQLNAGDSVSAAGGLTVTNGDLGIDSQIITGTYTGKNANLDANTGTINATVSFDTLDIDGIGATLLGGYIGAPGIATQNMANLIKIRGASGTGNTAYKFGGFDIGYVAPVVNNSISAIVMEKITSLIQQTSGFLTSNSSDTDNDKIEDQKAQPVSGTAQQAAKSANCLVSLENIGCVVQ